MIDWEGAAVTHTLASVIVCYFSIILVHFQMCRCLNERADAAFVFASSLIFEIKRHIWSEGVRFTTP